MGALTAKGDNLFDRVGPACLDRVKSYESHAHAESIYDNSLVQLHCTTLCGVCCVSGSRYPDEHFEQGFSQTYYVMIPLRKLIKLSFKLFVDDLSSDELMFSRTALFRQCVSYIPGLRSILLNQKYISLTR